MGPVSDEKRAKIKEKLATLK